MHWRAKGMLQKVLGHVPGGEEAHYVLQRRFGGLRDFGREFDVKMDDWRLMAGHLSEAGRPIVGARLFEIGSGWYPTFPFACYLGGARSVVTVDLNRHLKPELARACAIHLGRYTALIATACGIAEDEVRQRQQQLVQRLDQGVDIHAATDGVVTYDAPSDAAQTRLEPRQIDCVFSNSVLEHVLPDAVDGIFREAMRILAPGGIMFHSVNCGDHYAYIDHEINQLNYLQYSDAEWRRWDNAFLYQNRLRAFEFIDRAKAAGFDITMSTEIARENRLKELAALHVHPQFAHIPPERLCVTSIDFIARKHDAEMAG
ncbi:class I SAM-dependent methyltransferase [Dyella halodurans]|uniref:Methyltransferase domain-containing protein n=1 Tax=Dyella halodurans TaxID=1920171 RepID=A0ABV9C1I5_9GAMM|nr:class I SAM-dependent methyltransferase [Dyella halodurans]